MKQYKVVPYAGTVVLTRKEKPQDAIVRFYDVIKQECVDGWELLTVDTIPVTKKRGSKNKVVETYKALIFVKEQE